MLALSLLPAVVLGVGTSTCASEHTSCYDSKCCKHSSQGCFKMQRSEYAICMKYSGVGDGTQTKENCVDAPDNPDANPDAPGAQPSRNWLCPGWHQCAAEYADCSDSHCCSNPAFGCYKKAFTPYSMCRPLPVSGPCRDDTGGLAAAAGQWLCPGWHQCAERDGECTDSHCCKHKDQACYKRPYDHYAQCREAPTESEDAAWPWSECRDTDDWLCPGWETCDNPDTACTSSGCCNHIGFSCYAVTQHYSHCMRTGSCEAQVAAHPEWQQVSGLTCEVGGDVAWEKWEYVERRDSPDEARPTLLSPEDLLPSPSPPPRASYGGGGENDIKLDLIREELKQIRAAEVARQQAIEDRQAEMSTVELIVGALLILTIALGLSAFFSIWFKLSSRNLLMILQNQAQYSNMELGRVSSGNHELPAFPGGGLVETSSPISSCATSPAPPARANQGAKPSRLSKEAKAEKPSPANSDWELNDAAKAAKEGRQSPYATQGNGLGESKPGGVEVVD